ncbi:hypothetical protein ACIP5Y_40685 [Nocardia sp. NPDC088792]|uniref:hypothetical protein n=1 Tax=Nocardia sp. NPDC088792 TaxID=3364332 RepID=UPI00382FE8B7
MFIGGPLATAIDRVWDGIRGRHPDVPEAVVAIASGSPGRGRAVRRGHFGPDLWSRAGTAMPELFLGAEGLAAGNHDVLGTLLHEAAHGIALTREVPAVSDGGRYHNSKYKTIAEEIGLTAERHARTGWSVTLLPDGTLGEYRRAIGILERAIVAHRLPEPAAELADPAAEPADGGDGVAPGAKSADRNGSPRVCRCEPPRRIRAHKKMIAAGPILCGVCQQPFAS